MLLIIRYTQEGTCDVSERNVVKIGSLYICIYICIYIRMYTEYMQTTLTSDEVYVSLS